jgi:chromosome partitioning protein
MPKQQIVLAILANAGGVGKTTIAVHLAYALAQEGISVGLIDLDPQRALDVFCGLPPADYEQSVVRVLSKGSQGSWPFIPVWDSAKVEVCQGHPAMSQLADELVIRRRGEYALSDKLKSSPTQHEVVILDCPATLGKICENAVAASTHVLVPIQLEMKSISGVADLVQWLLGITEELQLNPSPPILGLVPSLYSKSKSIHRQYLQQLPEVAGQLQVNLYPEVRDSSEFKNASALGLPLQKHRPNHPACEDFLVLTNDVAELSRTK